MEPEIGHLVDQLAGVATVVAILGGHHHLGRLLANLFQEGIWTFVEEARDVTLVGIAA